MQYFRFYPSFRFVVIPLVLFSSLGSALESDFKACAAEALKGQVSEQTIYHIDISNLQDEISVRSAVTGARLEMNLTTTAGEDLGKLTCEVDHRGEVKRVLFERDINDIALN